MRRRKPDSIEVQQMKQQAKEERLQRQLEQERLSKVPILCAFFHFTSPYIVYFSISMHFTFENEQ